METPSVQKPSGVGSSILGLCLSSLFLRFRSGGLCEQCTGLNGVSVFHFYQHLYLQGRGKEETLTTCSSVFA
jgi:hypothetical protein